MKKVIWLLVPLFLFAQIEQKFNIKTVKVIQKEVALQKSFYAFVQFDQKHIYDIAPRFGGFIEKLYARELYQKVRKNETLALVYSPEVYRAKEEYKSSLVYGKDKRMIAAARQKLQLLDIDTKEIQAVRHSKKISYFTSIKSPIDGVIVKKSIYNESSFRPQETLFQIVDIKAMQAIAKAPQEDFSFIQKATKWSLFVERLHKSFAASHITILPKLSKKDGLLLIRADVKSDGELISGEYAQLIAYQKSRTLLLIPRSAVVRRSGVWYAFKKGEFEGEYDPVQIEIEPYNENYYIVTKGLQKGEEIADGAMFLLDSDAQINGLY